MGPYGKGWIFRRLQLCKAAERPFFLAGYTSYIYFCRPFCTVSDYNSLFSGVTGKQTVFSAEIFSCKLLSSEYSFRIGHFVYYYIYCVSLHGIPESDPSYGRFAFEEC